MTQVTIFRVSTDVTSIDDVVAPQRRPWSAGVRLTEGEIGILHVRRSTPRSPGWLSFFPGVDFQGINPISASSGAVLVVQRPAGLFAVVFGFGRYLLREGIIDERFGLRVTLNAMDASQLRSLDHKRLETVPRHTREQLGKGGSLGQFGLDIERDLLRGLTAVPRDRSLGDRLSGTDALTVVGAISLSTLPGLLDAYADLAERTDYRAVFPWVDNMAQVRDKRLIARLDGQVVGELQAGSGRFWLAVPEIIDWGNCAGFRYTRSKNAPICDELSLEVYARECGALDEMSLSRLGGDTVRCVRADDAEDMHRWPVRRCMVGEVDLNNERFIFSEGEWYRVDSDFLAQLEQDIQSIPRRYAGQLPRFNERDESEYNVRAARRSGGVFHLMDRDLVQAAPHGSVEVCDLYDRGRVFVHVKRHGGSSVLSHLFAQGAVSAELFYANAEFRRAVWEKLPEGYRWGADATAVPAPGQFEVCYAVIGRPGAAMELPFFSKVNLRKERRRLKQFGYEVSLAEITSA